MKKWLPKQVVGNAALYLVAHKLSTMGWNVMPTARNSKGPDLYILDHEGGHLTIQVKGMSGANDWPSVGSTKRVRDNGSNWWIVVANVISDDPVFYIQTPQEIIDNTNAHEWSKPLEATKDKWDRIGEPNGLAKLEQEALAAKERRAAERASKKGTK